MYDEFAVKICNARAFRFQKTLAIASFKHDNFPELKKICFSEWQAGDTFVYLGTL